MFCGQSQNYFMVFKFGSFVHYNDLHDWSSRQIHEPIFFTEIIIFQSGTLGSLWAVQNSFKKSEISHEIYYNSLSSHNQSASVFGDLKTKKWDILLFTCSGVNSHHFASFKISFWRCCFFFILVIKIRFGFALASHRFKWHRQASSARDRNSSS